MKILVLGGGGMLGHKVVHRLGHAAETWWTLRGSPNDPAYDPVPFLRGDRAIGQVDVTDLEAVDRTLRNILPDAVVNCVGIIKQRSKADDLESSVTVNSLLPHRVAKTLEGWGGRLIQISTDCVFSGAKGSYSERDAPDPVDLYGRTKLQGEVVAPNVLTLRTSIIGRELRHHQSLLDWFLAQRGRRIRGYRHAIWSGVTTTHLADVIASVLFEHPGLSGLYHLSSGRISKLELLHLLQASYDLDVTIDPDDSVRCDRSLTGHLFEQAAGYKPPSLQALIANVVADPTPYPVIS